MSYSVAPYAVEIVAYDLSSAMGEIVRGEAGRLGLANVRVRQGSVERLPFEEKSFDWVCTRYSAHHWSDVRESLAEARRVLKGDGRLVVVDVCSPGIPLLDSHLQAVELLRDGSHVRDYSVQEWKQMLEETGFRLLSRRDWKLPMEFKSWISRMKTPPVFEEAILSLFKAAPLEVRDYFQVAEDGSFVTDACLLELSLA